MKTLRLILICALLSIPAIPVSVQASDGGSGQDKGAGTTVYYFHLTRRCMTCQTVEKVAMQSVEELYPEAFKDGKVQFKSVNIEEKGNKALLKQLKVSGQSLLIVNGKEQVDITDKGFMYAVNQPEKLREEMKSVLDRFVK